MKRLLARGSVVLLSMAFPACAGRGRPAAAPAETQLAVTLPATCASPDPPGTPAPCGALGRLDRLFNDAYKAAQDRARITSAPVVLVSGSTLVLQIRGKEQARARVIPDMYQALKSVAHFPFAVYLRLVDETGAPLSAGTRSILDDYLALEPAARADLSRFALSPEQLARQRQLLDLSVAFVREVRSAGSVTAASLDGFARRTGPLLLENTGDAGCAQVLATHRQMQAWRRSMPNEQWTSMVVVKTGGHQARYRNAATQYFGWLLGERAPAWTYPGESMRYVYGESLSTGDDANDLLGKVVLDARASRAFFGDAWRLSEDVLSDGAARCIAALPPSERWTR